MAIYDAAMSYIAAGAPTVVFAGEEYGTGSSRDWAAKGTALLGIKAVIARSFERIHRSNLVGMGVLPLQFQGCRLVGEPRPDRQRDDRHRCSPPRSRHCHRRRRWITRRMATCTSVPLLLRIDTAIEVDYYRHGGILPFVLRQLLAA